MCSTLGPAFLLTEGCQLLQSNSTVIHFSNPKGAKPPLICLSPAQSFAHNSYESARPQLSGTMGANFASALAVQASIAANTYVISGHAETKRLQDLLPGILNQVRRMCGFVAAHATSDVA
jgi:hypothetical protein